ncbi:TonB-dependent receptor [Rhodanobacter sp. OR444]|uniref:TonB-dependent receptor n=2 Tax=Rhodanobacteraceae TaxID=1775411 RepID=UPI0016398045|nr:TonB-dependent receptor [Rhodanobacter sp. OR444]
MDAAPVRGPWLFMTRRVRGSKRPRLKMLAQCLAVSLVTASPTVFAQSTAPDQTPKDLQAIIVTARDQQEPLITVPESITTFSASSLNALDIRSFNDYATKTPNLSFNYGSGTTGISAARTIAIRGIGGQNLFGAAGSTGFYIDDTPLPESIDPRIVDMERIEVLKGPQGTLFGQSSLGGTVRIITQKPDLSHNDVGFMTQAGFTSGGGSPDKGGSVTGNLVVIPDEMAIRAVLFANHDAGYLTRTYPSPDSPAVGDPFIAAPRTRVDDQGAQTTYGGSITTLLRVTPSFDATLRFLMQNTYFHGFPATFAPLPSFKPAYQLDRAFDIQPSALDKWYLPSLDLRYHGDHYTLVSVTSYFDRHSRDIEDSTYGTQQVMSGYYGVPSLPPQPFLWDQEHHQDQFSQELRWEFTDVFGAKGTLGAFYSKTHTTLSVPPEYAQGLVAATADNTVVGPWPDNLLWIDRNPGMQEEKAIFGEIDVPLAERWTATLGARQYWLHQTSDFTAYGFNNFGATTSDPQSSHQSGLDPRLAIRYQATPNTLFYASASKGFRAGAAQQYLPFCALPSLPADDITHLKSDTLWSYEVGAKTSIPDAGIFISASAYHIDWRNLQQQVALPCGAYFSINGRHAHIDGGEVEFNGRATEHLELRAGVGYERSRINDPGALSIVGITPGSSVLGVPTWTATLAGVYTHPISRGWDGYLEADAGYTGSSRTLLNGGNGLFGTRDAYVLTNVRVGVRHGPSDVSLNVHNAGNAKPNLGDIGYVGYAQYTQNGTIIPQVATLPPRTVLLEYRYNY